MGPLVLYCEDGLVEISKALPKTLYVASIGEEKLPVCRLRQWKREGRAMYDLIGTCKLDGVNPFTYFEYVLTHIADYKVNRIDELLSWTVIQKLRTERLPLTSNV
ncbi:conserved hypothetical protein [Ricinus communis]|uniref:Transposase IS66 C-terminal domain-containing protein n=1 Tax=Ricinus communis TaxID=3988 RepID=B9TJY8_RICCO|nr:conserved hypothetical protein [Ricinus communis]